MAPRICLIIALASGLVLTGALLLPVAPAPSASEQRPACTRGGIAAITTDCRRVP
ncbi:hypothetical protein ACRAVF_34040 (plasmid) [Bradyrhizobium oligotrophicum S58]